MGDLWSLLVALLGISNIATDGSAGVADQPMSFCCLDVVVSASLLVENSRNAPVSSGMV